MIRFCLQLLVVGVIVGLASSQRVEGALLDHEFHLLVSYSDGVQTAIPPTTHGLEVTALATGNPLYEGTNTVATNPLYQGAAAPPGTPPSIETIAFTFGPTTSKPDAEGLVHRELAASHLVFTTNSGTYESAVDEQFFFSYIGPADLSTNVGPVRWMAPESIRALSTNGGGDYWDLAAGSYFLVSYPVPEPSTAILLALATVGAVVMRTLRTTN